MECCTGIRLTASNQGVVYGRTMEWGTFDLCSRIAIIPRGYPFTGLTPDGLYGMEWQATYGVVGLDMVGKDFIADGINEKGLAVGLFYHKGVAAYAPYDSAKRGHTITALDVSNYILSRFASIHEVRQGMKHVRVVAVVEEEIGIPVYAHWMVTDSNGDSIVIEFIQG